MTRSGSRRPFPYAERVREAQAAHEAVRSTFRVMWDARADRNDPKDPRTAAWQAALVRSREAWERVFPPDFSEAFAAVKRGERAGLDEMLAFLEADPRFFRSGYIKADVLRAIKRVPLEPGEAERLLRVVLDIVDTRDGREFRDYCRLARHIATSDFRREIEGRTASTDPAIARRARWISAALGAS